MASQDVCVLQKLVFDYKTGSVPPPYQYSIHAEIGCGAQGLNVVYERKHLYPDQAEDTSQDLVWSGQMPPVWSQPITQWANHVAEEAKKHASEAPKRPLLGGDTLVIDYTRPSAERVYTGAVSERQQWRQWVAELENAIRFHLTGNNTSHQTGLIEVTPKGVLHMLVKPDFFKREVTLALEEKQPRTVAWSYEEYTFFRDVVSHLSFYSDGEMKTMPYKPGFYLQRGGSGWYKVGDGIQASSGHADVLQKLKNYYPFLYKKFH